MWRLIKHVISTLFFAEVTLPASALWICFVLMTYHDLEAMKQQGFLIAGAFSSFAVIGHILRRRRVWVALEMEDITALINNRMQIFATLPSDRYRELTYCYVSRLTFENLNTRREMNGLSPLEESNDVLS